MSNYIPAGEDNTSSKRPFGMRRPNFIPGDKPAVEQLTVDEQVAEAKEARVRSRARAKQQTWDAALKQVRKWTPSLAATNLRAMPLTMREMYLLAEEQSFNRSAVLGLFPPAGPTAREVWADYAESSTATLKPASTIGK